MNEFILKPRKTFFREQFHDGLCLHIQNGNILEIQEYFDIQVPTIETSAWLIPAGVDPQVHLRVPGQLYKETPETGLKACISGGVGAVLTMPNTNPVIDSAVNLELGRREMSAALHHYPVEVYWTGSISKNLEGKTASPYKELLNSGVKAFTDDGKGVESDEMMANMFAFSADHGVPVLQHAEFCGHGGVLAACSVQKKLGITAYDEKYEVEMVERDLRFLKKYPQARYHVLHVSSRKTVEAVMRAKDEGLFATCEVSPHHLFYSCEDIQEKNFSFKMNPPLRTENDRSYLLQALARGDIDFVATDHAPHEESAKSVGFAKAAFGTIGLETFLPVLVTFVNEGLLSWKRLVEVYSSKAAMFLGIEKRFGEIAAGKVLNAVLIHPEQKHKFTTRDYHSLSKNCCFDDEELFGKIESVFLNGKHFRIND